VKVGRGKVEITFADEQELAEIAEALERAAGSIGGSVARIAPTGD
jgi:hypothetical protein